MNEHGRICKGQMGFIAPSSLSIELLCVVAKLKVNE